MASRTEKEKQRLVQDKCQVILGQILREEDNKYCVDCDAKGPRWASWNLGIFLCIRCAGIHRNLGVHISKVKSVNLDVWTPEQVGCLQQMGNSKARAVYEANLPDNFRRPQTDSSLEAFVRAKYEQKKYIAKEWIPPTSPKPAFDIEEEHRKEKEKKRTRNKNLPNVELPPAQQTAALPRPHSGAGGTSASSSANVSPASIGKRDHSNQGKKENSPCIDLLGLDLNGDQSAKAAIDDPFDVFMSAQPVAQPQSNAANPASILNESKTPGTSDELNEISEASKKAVLSKESILSLYGNGTTQPSLPTQQPAFGVPGGVYLPPNPMYCQPGMGVGWPQANVIPQESGGLLPGMQAQAINQQLTNASVSNPFLSMGMQGAASHQGALGHSQMHHHQQSPPQVPQFTNPLGMDPSQYSVATNSPQYPQMPSVNLAQVQQQMAAFQISGFGMPPSQQWGVPVAPGVPNSGVIGGLPPGQAAPAAWGIRPAQGHTLSTNLWQ